MAINLYHGDCLEKLSLLEDNSVDSLISDPPAAIAFMGSEWDSFGGKAQEARTKQSAKQNATKEKPAVGGPNLFGHSCTPAKPEPGQREAFIEFITSVMKECLRVVKPGGHALIWSLPRTTHWTAMGVENAGWEIRDSIVHHQACLSDDTEIFANGKWKNYKDLVVNDDVLCYDNDLNSITWMPAEKIFIYDYCDIAYNIKSNNTDQIVTKNHRCLVGRSGKFEFQEAETLGSDVYVPILANMSDLLKDLSIQKIAHTTYMWREMRHSIQETKQKTKRKASRKYKIQFAAGKSLHSLFEKIPMYESISSSPEQNLFEDVCRSHLCGIEIVKNNKETSINLSEVQDFFQAKEQCVHAEILFDNLFVCSSQRRPEEDRKVKGGWRSQEMDREKLYFLLEEFKSKKGTRQSGMERRCNLFQKTRQLQRSRLCEMPSRVSKHGKERWICDETPSCCGYGDRQDVEQNGSRASHKPRSKRQQVGKPDVVSQQLRSQEIRASRYARADLATVTPIEYNGIVWCVKVPTGAFVARRNGKIFITGNSGFPKGMNLGKAIDEHLGATRKVVGLRHDAGKLNKSIQEAPGGWVTSNRVPEVTEPATDEAKKFHKFGTALKPASEFWILARKPLGEKTIVANVLKWGTGGINIEDSRIETKDNLNGGAYCQNKKENDEWGHMHHYAGKEFCQPTGRFPANLMLTHSHNCVKKGLKKIKGNENGGVSKTSIGGQYGVYQGGKERVGHDFSDENGMETVEDWDCAADCPIRCLNEQSGVLKSGTGAVKRKTAKGYQGNTYSNESRAEGTEMVCYGDSGGAARFFKNFDPDPFVYQAKASRSDKNKQLKGLCKMQSGLTEAEWVVEQLRNHNVPIKGVYLDSEIPIYLKGFFVPLENRHPTVKSIALMRYLIQMITPPDGVVLDPFMGSGSTGVAATALGFGFVGIEQCQEYFEVAEHRIKFAT